MLNATIVARRDLTESLAILQVRPDAGPLAPFEPGQFITLGLPNPAPPANSPRALQRRGPGLLRRAYSIASGPDRLDQVELFIARVDGGRLTPRLWDVPVGGRLWMDSAAAGNFTLDCVPSPAVHIVLAATGTGIAPFVSMVRHYLGRARWRRAAVLHSVRQADDLGYFEELRRAAAQDATLRYVPTLTREAPPGWTGRRGRLQGLFADGEFGRLAGFALAPADCQVFLCGNPAMIDEVVALLRPRGFNLDPAGAPPNLHFERYW